MILIVCLMIGASATLTASIALMVMPQDGLQADVSLEALEIKGLEKLFFSHKRLLSLGLQPAVVRVPGRIRNARFLIHRFRRLRNHHRFRLLHLCDLFM